MGTIISVLRVIISEGSGVRTVPSGLLLAGILALAVALLMWSVLGMRRAATRQWGAIDPLDQRYGSTVKRVLYRAARVHFQTYAIVACGVVGVCLLLASAIAKLA